jgi:fucose permease
MANNTGYEVPSLGSFLQPPNIPSLFGPNILLNSLFSYRPALSLCSCLNVRDQVSHPYKTTGKILVLCILIFTFLDSKHEARISELNDSKHCPNSIFSSPHYELIFVTKAFLSVFISVIGLNQIHTAASAENGQV